MRAAFCLALAALAACRTLSPGVSSVRDEGTLPFRESTAEIASARLTDDATAIQLTLRHTGGCGEHKYELKLGVCEGDAPLNCVVALVHKTNDTCEAFLTREVTIPLAKVGLAKPAYSKARIRLYGAHESVASVTLPEIAAQQKGSATAAQ